MKCDLPAVNSGLNFGRGLHCAACFTLLANFMPDNRWSRPTWPGPPAVSVREVVNQSVISGVDH